MFGISYLLGIVKSMIRYVTYHIYLCSFFVVPGSAVGQGADQMVDTEMNFTRQNHSQNLSRLIAAFL